MTNIYLIDDADKAEGCFDLLLQLHPSIQKNAFITNIQSMYGNGYRLVALEEDKQVKAVAGFHVGESFGWKKYLYVDDLVTDEASRSKGYGAALIKWLRGYAGKRSCDQIHLDSRVTRYATHKFYLNNQFYIGGYHFLSEL